MAGMTSPEEQRILAQVRADLEAGKDPYGDDEEIIDPTVAGQAAAAQAKLDEENGTAAVTPPAGEQQQVEQEDPEPDPAAGEEQDPLDDAAAAAAATAAAAPAPAAAAAPTPQAQAAAAAPAAAAPTPDPDDIDPLEPAPWMGEAPDTLKAAIAEADAKEAELTRKLHEGEIEPADFVAQRAPLLATQRSAERMLARAEERLEQQTRYYQTVNAQIVRGAKAQGIDYLTDKKAQRVFDVLLQTASEDPANQHRSYKSLAKEAHSAVMASRGIDTARRSAAAAPAPAGAPAAPAAPAAGPGKPPARAVPPGPTTLRNVPAAATANGAGGSPADSLANLSGQAFEKSFGSLTPAQKAKLVNDW